MRFLANENIPRASILRLRAAGHEVASVRENRPGSTDGALFLELRTAHIGAWPALSGDGTQRALAPLDPAHVSC